MDAEGAKIDAKWALEAKQSEVCQAAHSAISLGVFFLSIFCVFAKSLNPPKYRACRQKQRFGPLRCGSHWNLEQ